MLRTGTVEFFKDDKGYGQIRPDEPGKEVFVHHSAIVGQGDRPTLARGDRVEYELIDNDPRGPRAKTAKKID
ncbi:MAG TPA: cold shock domain-containing protein [Thermoanaerobaculia bacterium]|nr:cold shock domain-containing protein [Thermoanaerobaculia bacterium]